MGVLGDLLTLTAYGFSDQHRVDTKAQLQRAQATLDVLNAEAGLRTAPASSTLVDAAATITSVTRTGVTVNDAFQVALGLLVLLPGGASVPVTVLSLVPAVRIPAAQAGQVIPVRVDPRNPAIVVVDWDRVG